MKNFNVQETVKTGFTKSKAYGLCGTLALATALLIGAGAVSADEATETAVILNQRCLTYIPLTTAVILR